MTKLSKILIFSMLVIGFWALLSSFVLAQRLELDYPGLPGAPDVPDLPDFIQYLFRFALGSAGALAFGVIVFGGIRYITSAGNPSAQGDAKQLIQGAILGLLLLLGSVLILNTINPGFTNFGTLPDLTLGIQGAEVNSCIACLDQFSDAECGCVYKDSGDSFEHLSCPRDNSVPGPTNWWCTTDQVCVDFSEYDRFAGRPQDFVYCCNPISCTARLKR